MRLVKQNTNKDCGVACISMLINHHFNFEMDIDHIKYQLDLNDEQLSFSDIIDISRNFDLFGEAFEVDNDFIDLSKKVPFIAQIINKDNLTHFVVVGKISSNYVFYFDPSLSKKQKVLIDSFLDCFQNYVITFKYNKKNFKKKYSYKATYFKNLFTLESFVFIWLCLIMGVLVIIETRIIKIYSETLMSDSQIFSFYLFFLLVYLFNMICRKISNIILEKSYSKK